MSTSMLVTVAEFHIYAQCGEDASKRGRLEAMYKIVMEITLLIIENRIVFLNFYGNPV